MRFKDTMNPKLTIPLFAYKTINDYICIKFIANFFERVHVKFKPKFAHIILCPYLNRIYRLK